MSIEKVSGAGIRSSADDYYSEKGLHPAVLPYEGRHANPIEVLCIMQQKLDDYPKTAQSIRLPVIKEHFETKNNSSFSWEVNHIVEAIGSWKIPRDTGLWHSEYINPGYIHKQHVDDVVEDDDERIEIIKRTADLGLVDTEEFAARFGMTPTELRDFIDANNIRWDQRKELGINRMHNTWKVIHEWGYSIEKIATAFGVDEDEVRLRVNDRTLPENGVPEKKPPFDFGNQSMTASGD